MADLILIPLAGSTAGSSSATGALNEYRIGGRDIERMRAYLAERGINATVEFRGAFGHWVLAGRRVDVSGYTDDFIPADVRQAVAFLRTRADAGDNVARATLVLFRYINRQLGDAT